MGVYTDKYKNYSGYIDFINKYKGAKNASSGSEVDANANVDNKNIATLQGEIPKRKFIGINRKLMIDKITELYGADLAEEYIRQLEEHEIYKHDETRVSPYTYSSCEVVNVKADDKNLLISLGQLYDYCEEPETLLDKDKDVWGKYPKDFYIRDKDGEETKILRLIRKKRHRNLVRVKTSFGEDLVVTDNHPLIVSNDKEKTVEALHAEGLSQYRDSSLVQWGNIEDFDIKKHSNFVKEDFGDFFTSQYGANYKITTCNSILHLDEDFGYFVGFFIGDGNFNYINGNIKPYITITQKDKETLKRLASIIHTHIGATSDILYKEGKNNCWVLRIYSPDLVWLLKEYFHIGHLAQNKNLPINIFDFSKSFAEGIIAGLVDSDGNLETNGSVMIRLSSRSCVQQLTILLKQLGFGVSNTYQSTSFGNNEEIRQKYAIWGVKFSKIPNCSDLRLSTKWKDAKAKTKSLKYSDGWTNISNVQILENDSFLTQNDYIYDITTESHSFICNNLWVHNCVSITMYPFLFEGLNSVGGMSDAPKHLDSFCGEFINLVFAIASQFAGAVSTPEVLTYMDYFIRKEYGDDYYKKVDATVSFGNNPKTIDSIISDKFAQIVYSINQPAAARDFQSVFWNIAYFDKNYFKGIFADFVFPDGSAPIWESVNWLQKRFMRWFNAERLKKPLTFPVETVNLLDNGTEYEDKEWADFAAEMYAEGHSFFTYRSSSVDSLASCCRLRNELQDNTFSFTLGAGGVSTGSKGVMTININRLVQNAVKKRQDISDAVAEQVKKVHCYLKAFDAIMKDNLKANLLPVYNAGYISMDKQFLTIGVNGFVEGAEFLGIPVSPNEEYFNYCERILKPIYDLNKAEKTEEIMFNTEFVPAENLGVKNAKWDKEDGYFVPRDCYNSYFYIVEDKKTNTIDKFILHGNKLTKYLDGGSALHANLEEHLSKEQYKIIMKDAIKTGCSYFTFNIPNTICNDCGHISKHRLTHCEKCGSANIDYLTRVIGYLKRVSSFSAARQAEEKRRFYDKEDNMTK